MVLSLSSFGKYTGVPTPEIWLQLDWGSLVVKTVKNLPAMREIWIQPLGWDNLLETGMSPQASILAWRIPWTEEPDGLYSMGLQRVGHD